MHGKKLITHNLFSRKKVFLYLFAAMTIIGCKKEKIPPPVSYHNLNNLVVSATGRVDLDIDKHGVVDFTVATNVVSPDINDHIQYRFFPKDRNLILSSGEQLPKALERGQPVTMQDQVPYY